MRYSVADRFRGAFLGALVGEIIASKSQLGGKKLHWSQMVAAATEVLIQTGKFASSQWQHLSDGDIDNSNTAIDILATLPISLFFHENTIQLRSQLKNLELWRDRPTLQEGGLAVGYALAQILNEKLIPHTLIEETIKFVDVPCGRISQKLLKVSDLLQNGAELETARECFGSPEQSNAIAMAFYCFLSTPEDFRLGILRATNTSATEIFLQCVAPSAIAGALLGAYNSIVGIPVSWYVEQYEAKLTSRGIISFSRMIKLADMLAVIWSGVYDIPPQLENRGSLTANSLSRDKMNHPQSHQAVAAPRVIR